MPDVVEMPEKGWTKGLCARVGSVWKSPMSRKIVLHAGMMVACATIVLVSQAEPAHAQSLQRLEQAVEKIVDFFTGKFGRSVGALAFIAMFLSAAFSLWSWGSFLRVGGAVLGVFASAEIVNFLSGG